jgi:hypothetical protein
MNERIKEITRQVLDELVPETWVALGYDKIKEIQCRTAELIVSECVEQSLKVSHRNDDMGSIIANMIKQHFGVEE